MRTSQPPGHQGPGDAQSSDRALPNTGAAASPLRQVLLDRIVYSTITLMSVLIVYDGWQSLKLIGVVGVIVGPVLAMFLSHVFSAALAQHVTLGRRLSRPEWLRVIGSEAPFLLLAAPPLAILALLDLSGASLTAAIRVMLWIGTATLGFWSGLAGHRAGLRRWALALVALFGLLIGCAVLSLQVFLQPGKAFSADAAIPAHSWAAPNEGSCIRNTPSPLTLANGNGALPRCAAKRPQASRPSGGWSLITKVGSRPAGIGPYVVTPRPARDPG